MKHTPKLIVGLVTALTMGLATAQTPPPAGPGPEIKPRPAQRALTRAEVMEMAGKRFDMADTNKDGILTPEEQLAHRPRPMPRPDVKGPPSNMPPTPSVPGTP